MAGGYDTTPLEPLDRLMVELRDAKARISELERPTGSQFQPVPVAATGGTYSQFNINTVTGLVWVDNSSFASVDVQVPKSASGTVLVTVSADITLTEAGAGFGQLFGYVGYNTSGGTDGSTFDALTLYTQTGSSPRMQASWSGLVTLAAGSHTIQLAAGYKHSGTTNGSVAINNMTITAQVLK